MAHPRSRRAALWMLLLMSVATLVSVSTADGIEPSYRDCRPHIDATIRDLASKALSAGEEPKEPPQAIYGDVHDAAPPDEAPAQPFVSGVPTAAPVPGTVAPTAEKRTVKKKKSVAGDSPASIQQLTLELTSEMHAEYEQDIVKIKDLSKMLKDLEQSLKEMKMETAEKYKIKKDAILNELEKHTEKQNIEFNKKSTAESTAQRDNEKLGQTLSEKIKQKTRIKQKKINRDQKLINKKKMKQSHRDRASPSKEDVDVPHTAKPAPAVTPSSEYIPSESAEVDEPQPQFYQDPHAIPIPITDTVPHVTVEIPTVAPETATVPPPVNEPLPSGYNQPPPLPVAVDETVPTTTSAPPSKAGPSSVPADASTHQTESVPAPPPVAAPPAVAAPLPVTELPPVAAPLPVVQSIPEAAAPPVAASTPVAQPPPVAAPKTPIEPALHSIHIKSEGIINKFVENIFGKILSERDPKWATPWQTHAENIKSPPEEVQVTVGTKPGVISTSINKFVSIVFGVTPTERDPKWAKPWQTHKEDIKIIKEAAHEDKPKAIGAYGGILHKFVCLIFPEPKGSRDPKYSKPWQTHEEQVKKFQPSEEMTHVPVAKASGGIIDKIVKLVFPGELGERDPKYSRPWQTHAEHVKQEVPASVEKIKVGSSGGLIDSLVRVMFSVKYDIPRDLKWAQPWQTHDENIQKEVTEPVVAVKKSVGFEFINSFIKIAFGDYPKERNSKWSKPWQSHEENKKAAVKEATVEKKAIGPSGGIFDKLVNVIFNTKSDGVRDPKYATPWQTHEGSRMSETRSPPPSVVAPAHPPVSIPAALPVTPPAPPAVAAPVPQPAATHPSQPVAAPAPLPGTPPTPAPVFVQVPSPDTETVPISSTLPKPAEPATNTKADETPLFKEVPKVDEKPTIPSIDQEQKFPAEQEAGAGDSIKETPSASRAAPVVDIPAPSKEAPAQTEQEDDGEEQIILVPSAPRSREHIESILGLDETSRDASKRADPISEATLKELKNIYGANIKPLEATYKYQDISNRHMSDAEIFSQPVVLMLGPYSTGKSTFLNYLMNLEYTRRALRTGANPSHGVFRIIQHGADDQDLDGTALSAHHTFQSLQKFGQNFIDQLRGKALNVPLLKKVTFVESPGILEMRRAGERLYPFNDVLQWFIDRADLVLVMFDYTKLDAGYELEAVLDQLKGREAQVRILLNKADQIPPEELIKVQGSLFWNLSPLLGASAPPTVYAGSFSSRPYRPSSPARLFQAQEEALLHDIARAINSRVDNRVAIARRHAVRVRNHAQMVDTYLTTYNKNKGFLTSKHKLAEDIVDNPHVYNIYEGMSLLTNISRYDLPDPEVYRDFFKLHNLYDFPTLRATCSYLHGCPLEQIDRSISHDLPELLSRYRRLLTKAGISTALPSLSMDDRSAIPPLHHAKAL